MSPRTLLYLDIETAPALGYAWSLWETDIIDVQKDWYIMSFAVQWEGDKKVKTYALPDYPLYKKDPENDRDLVKDLWKYFDEAPALVAHNGRGFDFKRSRSRFLFHKLPPPRPSTKIDTLLMARNNFGFLSNKQDELAKTLKIGAKLPTTGKHMWLQCIKGNKRAWKMMRRYNAHDVVLLRQIYLRMRGYDEKHPNMNLLIPTRGRPPTHFHTCTTCGSHNLSQNYYSTVKHKVMRYKCNKCGHYSIGERIPWSKVRD